MTKTTETADISQWLRNASPGPRNECTPFEHDEIERPISERFERIVASDPTAVAVDMSGQTWTYDSLNCHANRVARAILSSSPAVTRPIGLFLGHGYPQIAGLLATLKAGCAYVPMNPADPAERAAYMLEDCETQLIITDDANLAAAQNLAGTDLAVINLDALASTLGDDNLRLAVSPDAVGAVFYTSGSEGPPKGVTYSHRNLAHHAWDTVHESRVCRKDRLAGATHFSTVVASAAILRGLLAGATLCPYDAHGQGIAPLARWLADMHITFFRSSPTFFRNFAATLSGREDLSFLRAYSLGGEAVHKQDVELYQRHLPDTCLLRVSLGATEVAGLVASVYLDKQTEIVGLRVPVGYPASDVDVMIVDDEGRDVGIGSVGEIVVRSRYLSLGYWRRPDLTAERFSSDPASPTIRSFHTGDLARRLSDGCLVHLGRKDLLIKVRGLRVEISEVEAELLKVPGILHAAVTVRPDSFGDQRLVACLVTEPGATLTVSRIAALLGQRLPQHMVPAAYVFVKALPMTASGKLDRNALPDPSPDRPVLGVDCWAARNEVEAALRAVWERVLDVHPIGVKDNFFELGGHSLSAARLMVAIEEDFQKSLPITVLLESPTIETLAGRISSGDWVSPKTPLVELQTTGSRPPLFCVEAKNAGLFVHLARRLGSEQPVYGLHPIMQRKRITVASLAESYLTEVRRIQPKGPYYLCGLCAGGTVAFEMALQLQSQGEAVDFLGLFDAFVPCRTLLPESVGRLITRFRRRAARRAARQEKQGHMVRRKSSARSRYARQMDAYSHALHKASSAAMHRYRPGQYEGRLVLFMAETTNITPERGDRSEWAGFASEGATTYTVPGMHQEMLREPNVEFLARHVLACLDGDTSSSA